MSNEQKPVKLERPKPPKLSPCDKCPWRTDNHQKRHKFGFYTKKNLIRLWNGIRDGNAQSCHPTDASHPDHVACGAKPGTEVKECAGSVILVIRELSQMAALSEDGKTIGPEELDAYLAKRKRGLNKAGLLYWLVSRMTHGGVPYIGGPVMPEVKADDERISLPVFLEG